MIKFTDEDGEEENPHHPAAVHEHHLDDVGWFGIFSWKMKNIQSDTMLV